VASEQGVNRSSAAHEGSIAAEQLACSHTLKRPRSLAPAMSHVGCCGARSEQRAKNTSRTRCVETGVERKRSIRARQPAAVWPSSSLLRSVATPPTLSTGISVYPSASHCVQKPQDTAHLRIIFLFALVGFFFLKHLPLAAFLAHFVVPCSS